MINLVSSPKQHLPKYMQHSVACSSPKDHLITLALQSTQEDQSHRHNVALSGPQGENQALLHGNSPKVKTISIPDTYILLRTYLPKSYLVACNC